MKLASLRHGRDGRLVVVSDDLAWCADEPSVPTLQAALDDWDHAEPRLKSLSQGVNNGTVLRERFHEREAASPLPRAYQWADGSAYVNHVALVRQARGAKCRKASGPIRSCTKAAATSSSDRAIPSR
jgi:fumarylacetoacetate (FAA) hydrolase